MFRRLTLQCDRTLGRPSIGNCDYSTHFLCPRPLSLFFLAVPGPEKGQLTGSWIASWTESALGAVTFFSLFSHSFRSNPMAVSNVGINFQCLALLKELASLIWQAVLDLALALCLSFPFCLIYLGASRKWVSAWKKDTHTLPVYSYVSKWQETTWNCHLSASLLSSFIWQLSKENCFIWGSHFFDCSFGLPPLPFQHAFIFSLALL